MVTDILSKGTDLVVAGDRGLVERAFGQPSEQRHRRAPGRHEPQEAGRAASCSRALTQLKDSEREVRERTGLGDPGLPSLICRPAGGSNRRTPSPSMTGAT